MVKNFIYFLLFYGFWFNSLLATPVIDASIDSRSVQAHYPIQGTLIITHQKNEKIDPSSFTIEDKPLETSFVQEVTMTISSDTLVSIYNFELPAQDKGLYILPSIFVKIGNQTYRTIPSSYEVKGENQSPSSLSTVQNPSTDLVFILKAEVQGPSILYPGQRAKLFYRISYNRSIDLTKSTLPFVHPSHFRKIGDVQIRDYQEQELTIQELTQEIEASQLGTFELGPSIIEGYSYTLKAGQKVYDPTLLRAEAPAITLIVKSFPEMNQPSSFTGALGKISVSAQLLSSSKVAVGDDLQLQINIQGVKNLNDLRLPDLQCQPGFSGFFQLSDLPPLAEVKENTKVFIIELKPLTSLIEKIPSIEVSSFDPKENKYVIQQTSPIELQIYAHLQRESPLNPQQLIISLPNVNQWPSPLLSPLEFESSPVNLKDFYQPWIHAHGILWIIPLGIALLILQYFWHQKLQESLKSYLPTSEKLLKEALKIMSSDPSKSFHLLEQAFWQRLEERNIIESQAFHLEKLSQNEQLHSIYTFLFHLQTLQYSKNNFFDPSQLKEQALQLFKSI